MKYITFLTVTLVTPCCIQSMDKSLYPVPQAIVLRKKQINELGKKTENLLQKFKPDDKMSVCSLVEIIQQTDALKDTVTPKAIGFYFFQQQTLLNTLFANNSSPFHVSVFFQLIDKYNISLRGDALDSPTSAQIRHHLKNKKVDKSSELASMLGLIISANTLAERKVPIQSSIGLVYFDTLVVRIAEMIQKSAKEMKGIARLVYHEELMGQTPFTSSSAIPQK